MESNIHATNYWFASKAQCNTPGGDCNHVRGYSSTLYRHSARHLCVSLHSLTDRFTCGHAVLNARVRKLLPLMMGGSLF